ncbi:MAG: glycosyltransferase [Gemmataceae bacterium]|nr:glycosyltransferase [Gemmataceae bacterium]
MLGIDQPLGDVSTIHQLCSECPSHCALTILPLGYSTSVRHGGLYSAQDGGALRTVLSFAANARYVAYLDDDNWWHPEHLVSLVEAIQGKQWAFSFRWYVDEVTLAPLAIDIWESVGPNEGVFAQKFGGFVDPSSLLIDKLACEDALPKWCHPLPIDSKGMSADRVFFEAVRNRAFGASKKATTYYVMHRSDVNHAFRLQAMGLSALNR